MLTRSEALYELTRRALRATGTTERAFACAVADRYRATVPLHLRTIEFHAGDTLDAVHAERALKALADTMAAVQSLMAQIRQATGPAPKLRSLRTAAGEGA